MNVQANGTTEQHGNDGGHGHADRQLELTVFAPRHPKGHKFRWDKDSQVAADAAEAARVFGYAQGTFTLAKNGIALDRSQTLAAAGVHDHDELDLVDTGGGV